MRGITDAFVEQELNYPAIHIDVDRTKAAYVGLTSDEVIKNIITAMNSSVLFSPNFWDDPVSGNNYFIGAMYPEREITSRQLIENIPLLPSPSGMLKPRRAQTWAVSWDSRSRRPSLLRNIATFSDAKLPVEISHYNIQRVFDIMANVDGRDIGSTADEIDSVLKKVHSPRASRCAGAARSTPCDHRSEAWAWA